MNKSNISAAIVLLVLFFALAACGGAEERNSEELDMLALAEALVDGIAFDDQMEVASDEAFRALYAVDSADDSVADFVLFTSTGATAEEVSVIEARDGQSASGVLEFALGRVASQKSEFENYAPEEMAKLNDPVLVRSGKYIILCLSNDNATAKDIIEDFMGS
ncbi:MAG: DUF4358 domain-containing protein [Clostridiales Family XIII bacterium]|nr:DUF4358 domain-containing protein [Clostridiales Family XIII bacterium]